MFLEHRTSGERGNWKYPFKGAELLQRVRPMLAMERECLELTRSRLTVAVDDRSISITDPKINNLKHEVEQLAESVERLTVFVCCFAREPERVFNLTPSDVVYFGLTEGY